MTTIWRPHWLVKHINPSRRKCPTTMSPMSRWSLSLTTMGYMGKTEKRRISRERARSGREPLRRPRGHASTGLSIARSARCAGLVRTVVSALDARSAVGMEYASTVVCALSARSAVGQQSASTVVCALHARSAVGHQYASTVVERSQCKECGGASICEHGRERSKCKECKK